MVKLMVRQFHTEKAPKQNPLTNRSIAFRHTIGHHLPLLIWLTSQRKPNMNSAEQFELHLTPHGMVSAMPYEGTERWAIKVKSDFRKCEAAGLTALAAAKTPAHITVSALFWRDFAASFIQALCHLPQEHTFTHRSLSSPDTATLSEWILNAPPMQGAEYLSQDILRNVWIRMTDWTVTEARQSGGLNIFLKTYAGKWSRIGRVTVHLAENKGDDEYPFAFMATYAAGLSHTGRVKRLPLGQALRDYAGAGRKPELLKLLSPLNTAAKRSPLIADLIETGDINALLQERTG